MGSLKTHMVVLTVLLLVGLSVPALAQEGGSRRHYRCCLGSHGRGDP